MIYKDYFQAKDEEELQKQLQGIREPELKREVQHTLPQQPHKNFPRDPRQ
jgi:hypothetical protein